ncbi:MAG TPA: DUF3786 domain-containing protein [Candidatus Limnocylindrales bacterium]|nr:DUF3786 domain-containing protein [Candidatus Limnocylindrales bacterium]
MSKIYSFWVGNPEPLSYQTAFDYALSVFRSLDPAIMASNSGTLFDYEQGVFTVPSFGQRLEVTYPEGKVSFAGTGYAPLLGWRLITINYLARSDGTSLTGHLISYRELENGTIYFKAFQRESIKPLTELMVKYPEGVIRETLHQMDGEISTGSDFTFVCWAMPRFPITIKLWRPDDELPGSANILFDSAANHYLHTEDIAAAGYYASAFSVKLCKLLSGEKGDFFYLM